MNPAVALVMAANVGPFSNPASFLTVLSQQTSLKLSPGAGPHRLAVPVIGGTTIAVLPDAWQPFRPGLMPLARTSDFRVVSAKGRNLLALVTTSGKDSGIGSGPSSAPLKPSSVVRWSRLSNWIPELAAEQEVATKFPLSKWSSWLPTLSVLGQSSVSAKQPANAKPVVLSQIPPQKVSWPVARSKPVSIQKAPKVLGEAKMAIASGKLDATMVDLNMKDAEVGTVLQVLSSQSGVNLILASPSMAKVSLHLKQVTLIDAIRHLCAVSGLSFVKVGTTYVVAADQALKVGYPQEYAENHPVTAVVEPRAKITEVYATNYVNATQVAETLKTLFGTKDVQIVAGPISLSPAIQQSDTSHATGTSGTTLDKGDQNISRSIVLYGDPELVAQAILAAKAMDRPRAQVSIAVRISDVSDQAIRDIGLNWDLPSLNVTEAPNGIKFGTFSRSGFNFDAKLKALESGNLSKLLASPNISILDGEHGFVLIGDRLSYPVVTGYSQAGSPIISKEEKSVGVYMQVAANVSSDGTMTLSLYPQVSTVTGYLNLNGASYPQIATREAHTTVRIRSGETLVMGGLIRDEDVHSLEEIPLLSKIPIFGELFRHRNVTKTRSQVIITITPTIIPADRT